MYKFRLATPKEVKENKLLYAGNSIYGGVTEHTFALFLGKVITLFGKPDNLSDDWENMYRYWVTAEDEDGNKLILEIYHGSGGPSISMPIENYKNQKINLLPYEQAENELIQLIESQNPTDYEWESVYYDIPANIKYTVKDGKAYVESKLDEDFEDEDFDTEEFM